MLISRELANLAEIFFENWHSTDLYSLDLIGLAISLVPDGNEKEALVNI